MTRQRSMRRTAALVAGAALLTISLGGAATAETRDSVTGTVAGLEPPQWASCAAHAPKPPPNSVLDEMGLPALPGDFVPVSVVVCRDESKRRDDGSVAHVGSEFRATDIAALVAAMRLPDITRKPGSNVTCALAKKPYPWMALLDADGRWVRPRPPSGACGGPRAEVLDAIRALALTRVDSRAYDAHEAPAPRAAGCEATWDDHVWAAGRHADVRHGPGGQPLAGAARVGLCEYHVSAGERRLWRPIGDFARGLVLPETRRQPVERALSAAGPAPDCALSASRFAVLIPRGGASAEVLVELDGCQRILSYPDRGKEGVLSQGGPDLTRLLDESR